MDVFNKGERNRGEDVLASEEYAEGIDGIGIQCNTRTSYKTKLSPVVLEVLKCDLMLHPFSTCVELKESVLQATDVIISERLASLAIKKLGFSRKRTHCRYLVDPERIAQRRALFKVQINQYASSRMFLVDETGSGMIIYLCTVIPGELRVGYVLVMDNVSFHKTRQVKDILARVGAISIYTHPYSPNYNPIENVFGVVKHYFGKYSIDHDTSLVRKIEMAVDKVTLTGVLKCIRRARTFWSGF
jgi:transposase